MNQLTQNFTLIFGNIRTVVSSSLNATGSLISDIFGRDELTSVDNSDIITNKKDREKVSKAIDELMEEIKKNNSEGSNPKKSKTVTLENGKDMVICI